MCRVKGAYLDISLALFLAGTSVVAFVMLFCSLFFFTLFTRQVNEIEEIKNNNTAVGIVTAVIIIALALVLEHSITVLLSGFTITAGTRAGLPIGF